MRLGIELPAVLPQSSKKPPARKRSPIKAAPLDFSKSTKPDIFARAAEYHEANRLYRNAKQTAGPRGLAFELRLQDVLDLVYAADGKCMLTGIEFTDEIPPGAKKRLWRASLDRIQSSKGYLPGNVRIICVAANLALMEHGDHVFGRLARAFVSQPAR